MEPIDDVREGHVDLERDSIGALMLDLVPYAVWIIPIALLPRLERYDAGCAEVFGGEGLGHAEGVPRFPHDI